MVERARDTCACAFEHLLSFGVHMLSAVERARVHVLQMASAERVAMDRWPEHGAVGAVKAHARRVRRSRLVRRTHLSHCVSRRASAPRRGRLSVGGFQICERASGVVIPGKTVAGRCARRASRSALCCVGIFHTTRAASAPPLLSFCSACAHAMDCSCRWRRLARGSSWSAWIARAVGGC